MLQPVGNKLGYQNLRKIERPESIKRQQKLLTIHSNIQAFNKHSSQFTIQIIMEIIFKQCKAIH